MKRRQILSLLIACVLSANVLAECGRIVVFSEDAKYLVLDPETLGIMDVGNLWWAGVRDVGAVIQGSSFVRLGIFSSALVDVSSLRPINERILRQPARNAVILDNLSDSWPTADDVTYLEAPANSELRWLPDTDQKSFLSVSRTNNSAHIELLGSSFQILGRWDVNDPTVGATAICTEQDKMFIAGLDNVLEISSGQWSLRPVDGLQRDGGYRISNSSNGCRALLRQINIGNQSQIESGIVDISNGEILSRFSISPHSTFVLYDQGESMLEQVYDVVEVIDPEVPAYRTEPTSSFRTVRTSNGEVIREADLAIVGVRIGGKLSCSASDQTRFLLFDARTVYLLDPQTLQVTASRTVPFEGKHLAF